MLSYAATMGMEFEFSVLATAMEIDEETLAESLERLVHRGTLKELNYGDSYAFVRVVTLAHAYSDISSSRVRVMHKRVAEAYEKLNPNPEPRVIPEMGRHFHLARVHEKSFLYNRYAAMLAKDAFSPDVAIHHLDRAREDITALSGDHRLEESDLLKEMGEQYAAMGDDSRAYELYGQSLEKIPEGEVTLRALLLLSRADAARRLDKIGLTRRYCEEVLQLLGKEGHKKVRAMAHLSLARAAYLEGSIDVARREVEAALCLFDPERDAREVTRCYVIMGNNYSSIEDPVNQTKAIECYKKAIQNMLPLHNYEGLARVHNNIAVALGIFHPREALNELMEARACAVMSKNRRLIGWVLFNSVEILLALGIEKDAADNNAEARRILSAYNDLSGMQHVTFNEGIIAHHRKAYEESERAFLDSLRRAEYLDYHQIVVEVLIYMGTMYADWGRIDDAIKAVTRIREIGENNIHPANGPYYEKLKKRLGF